MENKIKETLISKSLGEYHELYGEMEEWQKEREKIEKMLGKALDFIETDQYQKGIQHINAIIIRLGNWKSKLNKTL